jgi:homoserine kinase|tara:strand:+ start:3678 stop:4601 length:924 start_codon:yes stop_codon:yes gene_type:complete
MDSIKIFSPATVANVGCGFDVLGLCLDKVGDQMVIRKTQRKGIFITKIEGFELPYAVHENVAGVSALAMYNELNVDFGFEIEIYKQIKPGSGIGSSAASAAGSVFGMNYLLDNAFDKIDLIKFAMNGEAVASKSEHADNIAPAILGGFTLVKQNNPLEVIQLPTPKALHAVIVHPQIEIKTADSRAVLPKTVALSDAITQWSNVGSLVHALHTSDYNLIGKSLKDVVIEPHRSKLIPNFNSLRKISLESGALGCSISGSGPSLFSLCEGLENARKVEANQRRFMTNIGIPFETHISKINTEGIKILS